MRERAHVPPRARAAFAFFRARADRAERRRATTRPKMKKKMPKNVPRRRRSPRPRPPTEAAGGAGASGGAAPAAARARARARAGRRGAGGRRGGGRGNTQTSPTPPGLDWWSWAAKPTASAAQQLFPPASPAAAKPKTPWWSCVSPPAGKDAFKNEPRCGRPLMGAVRRDERARARVGRHGGVAAARREPHVGHRGRARQGDQPRAARRPRAARDAARARAHGDRARLAHRARATTRARAGGDDARARAGLRAAAAATDAALGELQRGFDAGLDADAHRPTLAISVKIERFVSDLHRWREAEEGTRSATRAVSSHRQVIRFFSTTHESLIARASASASEMLATGHAPPGFAALLYSYVNLIVLKEKAGIERALIGSELALSGAARRTQEKQGRWFQAAKTAAADAPPTVPLGVMVELRELVAQQQGYRNSLLAFAPEWAARVEAVQRLPCALHALRMRATLPARCASRLEIGPVSNGDPLWDEVASEIAENDFLGDPLGDEHTINSTTWFEAHTRRIDSLNALAQELADAVERAARDSKHSGALRLARLITPLVACLFALFLVAARGSARQPRRTCCGCARSARASACAGTRKSPSGGPRSPRTSTKAARRAATQAATAAASRTGNPKLKPRGACAGERRRAGHGGGAGLADARAATVW